MLKEICINTKPIECHLPHLCLTSHESPRNNTHQSSQKKTPSSTHYKFFGVYLKTYKNQEKLQLPRLGGWFSPAKTARFQGTATSSPSCRTCGGRPLARRLRRLRLATGQNLTWFCFSGDFLFWALLFGTFWGLFFIFYLRGSFSVGITTCFKGFFKGQLMREAEIDIFRCQEDGSFECTKVLKG